MYDRLLTALNRFKGTRDQLFPALCQHLNIYVIRNHIMLNRVAQKIEFNLTCCRETNFDFPKAQLYQILKHFDLFLLLPSDLPAPGCRRAGLRCTIWVLSQSLCLATGAPDSQLPDYGGILIIHHCFFSPFVSCHSDCIYEQCSCHFAIRYRVVRLRNALLTLVSNNRMTLRTFYCHEQ